MKSLVYLTLSLSLISSLSMGQTRLGYVDFEQVKRIVPLFKAGERRIEVKTSQLNDSLRLMVQELNYVYRSAGYSTNSADIYVKEKERVLKEKERVLNELQNRIQYFQQNTQLQLNDMQKEIDADIRKIIIQNLKRFSFNNNAICVWDKEAILYCPTCVDLTYEFIAYYKTEGWKR